MQWDGVAWGDMTTGVQCGAQAAAVPTGMLERLYVVTGVDVFFLFVSDLFISTTL